MDHLPLPPPPPKPLTFLVAKFSYLFEKIFTNQDAPPVAGKNVYKEFFQILHNIIIIIPICGVFLSAYFNLSSSGFTFACPFQATLFK
jgi:hypothetical protein